MKVNKKPENSNNYIKVTQADVDKVRILEFAGRPQVFFTLIINGVRINDCRVVESVAGHGDFIGMPSRKGKDGKYYNYAYVKLSPEDTNVILAKVEKEVNS